MLYVFLRHNFLVVCCLLAFRSMPLSIYSMEMLHFTGVHPPPERQKLLTFANIEKAAAAKHCAQTKARRIRALLRCKSCSLVCNLHPCVCKAHLEVPLRKSDVEKGLKTIGYSFHHKPLTAIGGRQCRRTFSVGYNTVAICFWSASHRHHLPFKPAKHGKCHSSGRICGRCAKKGGMPA